MKIFALIVFLFFNFTACSSGGGIDNAPQFDNKIKSGNTAAGNAELSEKNKQIALKNEVTRATEAAQALEQQGRQLDSYRLSADAAGRRSCKTVEEDLERQAKDLEAKIKSFPEPYGAALAPVNDDLSRCVSCASSAMPACVRARASINKAIKDVFGR